MSTKTHFKNIAAAVVLAVSLTACAGTAERETPGAYADDSVITSNVKAAIVNDPVLKKNRVKVETFQNVVQLSGFVDTSDSVIRAGRLAGDVEGVRNVENNLIIMPPM